MKKRVKMRVGFGIRGPHFIREIRVPFSLPVSDDFNFRLDVKGEEVLVISRYCEWSERESKWVIYADIKGTLELGYVIESSEWFQDKREKIREKIEQMFIRDRRWKEEE